MIIPGWQQDILNKMHSGFKAGEMQIVSTGRRAGKSRWPQRIQVPYQVLGGAAQCDDGAWYEVYCRPDVAAWVRTQDTTTWMETGSHASLGNFFDIRDSVMTLLALKFS